MPQAIHSTRARRAPIELARADLAAQLRERRSEIEGSVLTRVHAVADPTDLDPEYAEGLRAAVSAALDYELAAIELGEERTPPPPPALLAQARLAARSAVSLDTVLRRCFAGHALLGDFLVEGAERGGLRRADLRLLLRTQAILFDRLIAAVSEEYGREERERPGTLEQRHAEQVERLLGGELIDTSELAYDFEGHHLGLIATGSGAPEAIRQFAASLDRGLLAIGRDEGTVWAWLGGRHALDPYELQRVLSEPWLSQLTIAAGETAHGLGGWRLTHQQARAALPVALRSPECAVRYADVALLASMLQDDLLATSLREIYLEPLHRERDGGEVALQTLRAYFEAERNVSSAAAVLGVKRHTVTNRLRGIEKRLGRPLSTCAAEIEAALRLEQLMTL